MHHCVHIRVSVCRSVCTPKRMPLGRGGKDWFHKYRDWLTSVPIPPVTIVSSPKTEEEKKKKEKRRMEKDRIRVPREETSHLQYKCTVPPDK